MELFPPPLPGIMYNTVDKMIQALNKIRIPTILFIDADCVDTNGAFTSVFCLLDTNSIFSWLPGGESSDTDGAVITL